MFKTLRMYQVSLKCVLQEGQMVVERDVTLGGEHMVQCADDVL